MYPAPLAIFAAVSLTTALPSAPISARQTGPLVYVCEDMNWKGACTWIVPTAKDDHLGDCLAIPYADNSLWLSFGPDQDLMCAVYPEAGCNGDPMSTSYPGSAHLPGKDNEGASHSFRCLPDTTPIPVDPKTGKGDPYHSPKVIG